MQGFSEIPPVVSEDTVKIKVGRQGPYLSTDQNHIWVDTTGPLGEQLRQVSKKSDGRMYGQTDGRQTLSVWAKLYLLVVLKIKKTRVELKIKKTKKILSIMYTGM